MNLIIRTKRTENKWMEWDSGKANNFCGFSGLIKSIKKDN